VEPAGSRSKQWILGVGLGIAALAFTRLRGEIPAWRRLHGWLHELGVPAEVRNLDSSLILLLAVAFGARLAAGRHQSLRALGLRGSLRTGLWFGLLAGAPMFLQGALTARGFEPSTIAKGMLLAPFVEEAFFRGLLVAIPVRIGGIAFWPTAIASGLLFGSMHVSWGDGIGAGQLPVLLVTGIGGVWFAWLCRTFDWNLWTTIFLHAAMNAAWQLFAISGDAAGGLWPNVGRGLTIALGTVLALRWQRRRAADRPTT
jgi:membrane protease YdiL (CAAX protease family)